MLLVLFFPPKSLTLAKYYNGLVANLTLLKNILTFQANLKFFAEIISSFSHFFSFSLNKKKKKN